MRGGNRKNRAGAGRRRTLKQAEEELATQVKAEEEAHGHRLGPEDILLLWREKLSQVAVNLYRESKSLAEKDCLGKEKEKQLKKAQNNLRHFGDSKLRSQLKADVLHAIGRSALAVQRKSVLSIAEEKVRAKLSWQGPWFSFDFH